MLVDLDSHGFLQCQKIKNKEFALNFMFPTKFLVLRYLKTAEFVKRQFIDFAR